MDEEQMITEKQLKFIENYCETGDAVQSAISAGYKNSHTIVNQAWKLKRDLSKEISKRMQEKFVDKAPVAFGTLIDLSPAKMNNIQIYNFNRFEPVMDN